MASLTDCVLCQFTCLFWRRAVIRPPSVSDSAEKPSSGLQLEPVRGEEKDSVPSPSAVDFMGEINEPKQAKHNGEEGKDSAHRVVTAEIGIQNKAITRDDEKEVEANTAPADDKQKGATKLVEQFPFKA